MTTLELSHVKKKYAETLIVPDLSLQISTGEFIVVVGPSGSGKSTVLRMVAGLEEVSSGEISIDGEIINQKEPKDRNIAMVFQNYALYPHMSVFENMAYGLKMRKIAKNEIKQRVQSAAKMLGLVALLKRKPKELSGGQRQRVAMGRAIVRKPAIFLFDEPLSNLDAKLRVQMRLQIKKLQQELKTTSLYVTHDQVEAMTLADRIVLLNHGRIEQMGTPLELYNDPASQFVAGFIGSPAMNFITVNCLEDGSITLLNGELLSIDAQTSIKGQQVVIGIRPEMLKIAKENNKLPTIEMHTEWVEALGTDTYIYGRIPGSQDLFTVRLSGKYHLASGEALKLVFDSKHVYFFDEKTGTRIKGAQ